MRSYMCRNKASKRSYLYACVAYRYRSTLTRSICAETWHSNCARALAADTAARALRHRAAAGACAPSLLDWAVLPTRLEAAIRLPANGGEDCRPRCTPSRDM